MGFSVVVVRLRARRCYPGAWLVRVLVGVGICWLWRQKSRHCVQSWRHIEVASLLKIDALLWFRVLIDFGCGIRVVGLSCVKV